MGIYYVLDTYGHLELCNSWHHAYLTAQDIWGPSSIVWFAYQGRDRGKEVFKWTIQDFKPKAEIIW